jgi:hypothetical protein
MTTRLLLFCPYLPLVRPLEFGPWWPGPLDKYPGRWSSPDFETRAKRFLGKFRDARNRPVSRPSLLARRRAGATGARIAFDEFAAVQLGLHLGLLDANPPLVAGWRELEMGQQR